MIPRPACFCVFVALLVVCSSAARAQKLVPIPDPALTAAVTAAMKPLSDQIEKMREEMEALPSKAELGDLEKRVEKNEKDIARLKKDMYKPLGRIDGLNTLVNQQDDAIRKIVEKIGKPTSAGDWIPDLSRIGNSPEGRNDLLRAMQGAMPRYGELVVENRMGRDYDILVNGRAYHVRAYETTRPIPVRVGTVTTELAGYELSKNWVITAPNWRETIIIGPSKRRPQIIETLPRPIYYYRDPVWGWVAVR